MSDKKFSTNLIHKGDGQSSKPIHKSASVPEVLPVYLTSVFAFDDVPSVDAYYDGTAGGYLYTRMSNPNTDAASEILAAADGADQGLVFSSGMAAIVSSIFSVAQTGDHIIASPVLYGAVYDFLANELKRFGIETTFVDFINDDIEKYIRPNTKLLYTETICNPLMEVPDIEKTAEIARKHELLFFVDNTFASPAVAKPILLGADLVLYSATKFLGGHSDITGGAVAGNAEIIKRIKRTQVLYGAVLGAFDSWLLTRSLRTLDLRLQKHSQNALEVAKFLESHPKIEKVFYPGLPSSPDHERAKRQFVEGRFGGMISANLKGGEKEASELIAAFSSIKFVPSLAGTATTVSYAAKTSHRIYSQQDLEGVGITLGQLRFSVGLEDASDIIAELSDALDKI